MASPPSLETVYQAVVALYHNQNWSEREKASQWLTELQKSVYSWKIADEMLQEKRDLESYYFAAQTMRTKIQYSFHELPPETHISLRDSLIQYLEQVNDYTNTVVVTQLSLALALLSLQMSSWEKPVLDLMKKFSDKSVPSLLEVLIVLPEEVNSKSLRLGENRRHQILEELASCSPAVVDFLVNCLNACLTNTDNQQIHVKVLRCFASWVTVRAISLNDVSNNMIAIHTFTILQNHQLSPLLHEAAKECVCSLLQTLEYKKNQQTLDEQLFRGVVALEESYHLSVAHEDQDKSKNYCRIFTELGESLLEKIVNYNYTNKDHYYFKVLDLVLMCVGHHDYEVAEITFNFWYRLSEELYTKSNDQLCAVFKPYVERLIESLCRHSRMEQDQEGLVDDMDEFTNFRNRVSELMRDVVFIVGSLNCFKQMFISLQGPGVTWDVTEAALFLMQSLAKIISPEENEIVPQVVKAILELDPESTHIAVRHTSVLLLGELNEWIEHHANEILNPVVYFLLFCLRQQPLTSAVANALQLISSRCSDKMTQYFNVLAVHIVEALKSTLSAEAALSLLKSISVILSQLPNNEIYSAMKSLCWVQIEPLRKLNELDINVANVKKGTPGDPAYWLDRLACIFRHTNPCISRDTINPCSAVLTEMWPVLSETCNKFQSDIRVMERCCRCLRFAVRCVGRQSCHMLQPVVQQIVPLYNVHRHSCFLYLGSILVDEFACEPQCVPGLLEMLQAFIQATFQTLQEENGLKNHPDTVDDFFRLCARFLQRIPVEFLQCPSLPAILECALMACSLDHRDANASTMKFFYDLFLCGRNNKNSDDIEIRKQLISAIVHNHGKRLVHNLIEASVFSLHSYMLGGVADVLMELLDNDRNAVSGWLGEALKALPNHNSGGATTATEKQLEDFHQSVISAQTSKSLTSLLKEFSRLYR
ncbi:hypothetical protein RUM43_009977 [Polyplax serrata]|uniref:Transportin-3 n=1 Tax=Polyplax serrata TaxID=468196 RepID=A0AAN8NZP7_POLSC